MNLVTATRDDGCRANNATESGDATEAWREFVCAAHHLTGSTQGVITDMLSLPNATSLLSRLLQAIGSLSSLIAEGERAYGEQEARRLREVVQVKNDFLRMTTHELRRPLGIVKGYLSMLEEGTYGDLPERMRDASRQIGAAARELADLVDGLVTTARLEDKADALHLAPHRLGQIVTEAIAAVEREGVAKHIRIERHISSPDPELDVDAERLRIAVVNLLSNAIRYSPESSAVTVTTRLEGSEAIITVTDQGPGIEPAEADSLFEEWHRGAGAEGPGLGLGLYIARRLVELHGGKLTVDSMPGRGSTFVIVLPRG